MSQIQILLKLISEFGSVQGPYQHPIDFIVPWSKLLSTKKYLFGWWILSITSLLILEIILYFPMTCSIYIIYIQQINNLTNHFCFLNPGFLSLVMLGTPISIRKILGDFRGRRVPPWKLSYSPEPTADAVLSSGRWEGGMSNEKRAPDLYLAHLRWSPYSLNAPLSWSWDFTCNTLKVKPCRGPKFCLVLNFWGFHI